MNAGNRTLTDWLDHAGRVHAVGIDLGLARVGRVADALGFAAPGRRPAPRSVIVAGTNGKGSTCVALDTLLRGAGLRVGTTLSPHLHRFNERVRVDGAALDDATLAGAFAAVEAARADVPLTYFEFAALVALYCFRAARVDVAVLEVGLGGRLDAFNLVDADVAVITSIGLDHQTYLGDDLEGIGREKAGVMRPGQRVVLGADVTGSVVEAARWLGCRTTRLGVDFHIERAGSTWDWHGERRSVRSIPLGALAPDNCALALEVADALDAWPEDPRDALAGAHLEGRMEAWRIGDRCVLLDVAHNPAGARFLAGELERRHPGRRFVAVFGMLADKDAPGVVDALSERVAGWICVGTRGPRGLSADALRTRIATRVSAAAASDAAQALDQACSAGGPLDGILAFGSFDLVEQMRDVLLTGHAGAVPERPAGSAGKANP
ncbi:MAG TPA: cyanophycin synthetase [Pseudomonadales bacterium]